jgi:hypothetical protein
MQTNDSEDEVEVAINLLNIARTFQGTIIVIHTEVECPFSPTHHYYVKMPCKLTTPITNLELVVNLKNPCLESKSLKCFIPNPTSSYISKLVIFATTTKKGDFWEGFTTKLL